MSEGLPGTWKEATVETDAGAAVTNEPLLPAIQRHGGPLAAGVVENDPDAEWWVDEVVVSLGTAGTFRLLMSNDVGGILGELTPTFEIAANTPTRIPVRKKAGKGNDVGYAANQVSSVKIIARPIHYVSNFCAFDDPN